MGTSSARPDDLDRFVRGSRELDHELTGDEARLRAAYEHFTQRCRWGELDATSLVDGYKRYPALNETDAAWVANIAASFRRAGGDGDIASLPDAALAASLRRAGLSDTRAALTFDSPRAYGFPRRRGTPTIRSTRRRATSSCGRTTSSSAASSNGCCSRARTTAARRTSARSGGGGRRGPTLG